MKLDCNFEINNKTIRLETYLEQKQDDCSIVATVLPHEIIPDLTLDCSLVSVIDSSELLLDKTSGFIDETIHNHIIKGNTQERKVKLASAKLVSKNPPKAHDTVLVQIYLTNIPYPFCVNNIPYPFDSLILTREQEGKEPKIYQTDFTINITGQPKVVIKPHSEGAISHLLEVDGVTFSELNNVIELIDSISFLISFASGCMCSIARIQVLHDKKTVHLEYISPENTKLKEGNKVIYDEEDIIKFIEYTYTNYISKVDIYKLKKLITLGILAKNTPYIENKTILMCNFLEILRYNHAIYCTNKFKKQGDCFYWADGRNADEVSFKKILEDFCVTNDLHFEYFITKIRNTIVHQGEVIGNNSEKKIENYLRLHHFCDRVILTLLKWDEVSGYYIPINKRQYKPINGKAGNRVLFNRKLVGHNSTIFNIFLQVD
ncbi:MAG: hypothetical protein PX635_14875 [Nostocales cyanobacterium LE14-WE12]|nr:hypothetical protein [Nostocales cyanobacterium LE14-WE12]